MDRKESRQDVADAGREARLRWRCRRGMLELDLLLGEFVERGLHALSDEMKRDFEALLEYPDPVLFDWLMGRAAPTDRGLAHVVERIRAFTHP